MQVALIDYTPCPELTIGSIARISLPSASTPKASKQSQQHIPLNKPHHASPAGANNKPELSPGYSDISHATGKAYPHARCMLSQNPGMQNQELKDKTSSKEARGKWLQR